MPTTHAPSLVQLRQAIEIHEQIQKLEAELLEILGGSMQHGNGRTAVVAEPSAAAAAAAAPKTRGRKKGSKVSAASRAKMAAAAKARWAKKG